MRGDLRVSRYLAERDRTTVDDVLTRELEDVACAHADELAAAVPRFDTAMVWPESGATNAQ